MGRAGEFELYERDCQRRTIERSPEYQYLKDMNDRLEADIKIFKQMLQDALTACTHCPNNDKKCGDTCSIKHIKAWSERDKDERI